MSQYEIQRFRIGDKIQWWSNRTKTGTVTGISDNGGDYPYLIKWDSNDEEWPDAASLVLADCYHDFQERIKDRMKV